ncbi:MAG: phage tail protein [Bacteroidaceae bacterium]|nr:phage tail protein [Bacteroidaceae bacterium]
MIPILFKADATNFSTFGIGALADTLSCEVTEERNGAYECVMKYPITGAFYTEIRKERLVKAKPNDTSKPQAFRIYRITKPLNGIVTIYAQHISYDLTAIATPAWTSSPITPQLAIEHVFNAALTPHNFTFRTDYTQAKEFSVSKPKSLRSVLGGSEGSLVSLWGGEFEWDNFNVIHHQGRGTSTGVVIEYGKNLTSLEQDADITSVYTDLLPYAVITDEDGNETVITLTEQILPIAETSLVQRKTLIKDFTDSFDMDAVITEEALRAKAEKYIEDNPLGVESPELKISFEPLWKQPEYAAVLERVSLCDRVTVRHVNLGVQATAKVTKTIYDSLAEKYVSVTLGSIRNSLIDSVSDTQAAIENTANKVERLPSLMASAIQNATNLITGQTGGYVVLHTESENGQPYELLILDAPSIDDAVNVWRWNVGGLGFSSHGYNGPYETAITADGQIVANFITSGTLVANIIKAGILSSQDGSSYWNLETGEVVLRAYATTETVEETNSRIDEINEQKMYRLIISSSNGNIFKNGNIQTTLTATVFSWDENITDTLDPNQFIWTRVSDDAEADAEWNAAHYGGAKSIEITSDDVDVRATFFCDLIDTTTRNSLLG